MRSRLFKNCMAAKTQQNTSIEWHSSLSPIIENEIIRIHMQSFGDLYANYSMTDLCLNPNINKNNWIRSLIETRLLEFKDGNHYIATVSIDDKICGFVMCTPVKSRHTDLKNDVFVSLLAVKPLRDFNGDKIRIGLGKLLIKSVMHRFEDANTIILDTRKLNKPALEFYAKMGFKTCPPFEDAPISYVGLEKILPRPKFI